MSRSAWLRTGMVAVSVLSTLLMAFQCAPDPASIAVDQGKDWTAPARDLFYTNDQGSRIMPLAWFKALKQPDGRPLMADSLKRYGFLPNAASPHQLPVGFTAAGAPGEEVVGMNCAACHTRQIEVSGTAYRIDGGPAFIDFQALLGDLDIAVGKVLYDPAAFRDFANAVPDNEKAALRSALHEWHHRYHTLIYKSSPSEPWGPTRLDALGMIFNRLTGLDIGQQPGDVIEQNIERANAPVRIPFLWNAHKQDKTQWSGIAPNIRPEETLARNIGQVYGVFGEFHPEKQDGDEVDYIIHNSLNIEGVAALEELTKRIGAPRWPWALDDALAQQGKDIFERTGCVGCHGERPSPENPNFWQTPIIEITTVKTDSLHWRWFSRPRQTGILAGAKVPGQPDARIPPQDAAVNILRHAVAGALEDFFKAPASPPRAERPTVGYEARVLRGVWAAAPYLHNGSVPTLAELLKPSKERKASFQIGPEYDPVAVGLAEKQTQFDFTLTTTDCSQPASGNSRCGHEGPEYGTDLTDPEKKALLEYLKSL